MTKNKKPYHCEVTFTVNVEMRVPQAFFKGSKLDKMTQCEHAAEAILVHGHHGNKRLMKLLDKSNAVLIDAAFESSSGDVE